METGLRAEMSPVDEAADIKLTRQELIERFAKIQQISVEEAEEQVGAPTEEEVLKKISEKTIEKINSTTIPMNRAQRRALKKKVGSKKYAEMVANGDITETISDTAKKLNYIHLIQNLRELNERKEKENGTATIENN